MESCNVKSQEWLDIQNTIEAMVDAGERYEEAWFENLADDLANIKQLEHFLKKLVKSHKVFQTFACC